MVQKNGYFQIKNKKDGTYITLYPPVDGGAPVSFDMLDGFLYRKKIDYDKKTLSDALKVQSEQQEVLLNSTPVTAFGESSLVTLQNDHLSAFITFFAPMDGMPSESKKDIVADLVSAGVKFGVDTKLLDELDKERPYCTTIELCKAVLPVEGKNAEIKYYFNTDMTTKPKMLEDGSVDFHSLNTICPVHEGDLIAELFPAVVGKPGIDVCGKQLKPKAVSQAVLKHANRIHLSEDGLKMYSDANGHVSLIQGKVFVSDTYEVPADVDSSTGDISCEGCVEVRGNVRTGFKIEAKGDVIVYGVVEGAEIISGGQIILERGIQGMGRGRLVADGNIITKFIESADVTSKFGYVQSEAIMHSTVSAKTDIIVDGKKGFISGGSVRCGQSIKAKTIGSTMGTATSLEVGIDPAIVEEYKRMEKELPELDKEEESINKNLAVLAKKLKAGEQLAVDKLLQLKNGKKRIDEIEERMSFIGDRMAELEDQMEMQGNGVIKVSQNVYSGCHIVIGGATYHVKSEISHCRFVKEGVDVKVGML